MKALTTEMTANFGNKLQPLGIVVRELTGDMQLTKKEIQETQVHCKDCMSSVPIEQRFIRTLSRNILSTFSCLPS